MLDPLHDSSNPGSRLYHESPRRLSTCLTSGMGRFFNSLVEVWHSPLLLPLLWMGVAHLIVLYPFEHFHSTCFPKQRRTAELGPSGVMAPLGKLLVSLCRLVAGFCPWAGGFICKFKKNLFKIHFKMMVAVLLEHGLTFISPVKYLAKVRVCVTQVRQC